jgi:hypothetical protein
MHYAIVAYDELKHGFLNKVASYYELFPNHTLPILPAPQLPVNITRNMATNASQE